MSKQKKAKLKWRSILTETLPYEVPVIFSNDRLYAALVAEISDVNVNKEFAKLLALQSTGASPYFYRIGKDRAGHTELAIIHPLIQLSIAEFIDTYAESILGYCKKSEFSLRRPAEVATAFSENELESEATPKMGIPHIIPADGEIDISRIASYFAYMKFNLLHRFYDSAEFLSLEKKFFRLRTLDVTKCFFNIYTHTITWAVKERSFAKQYRNAFSFESRFDQLMQKANSNETNGIVVGPEISRIFAEIIFQEIDRAVLKRLAAEKRQHGIDYAIRRYVDDYLVFASSDADLDVIEKVIREELARYKLFINEKKVETYSRPFVTGISLARREIATTLSDLRPILFRMSACGDERARRRVVREFGDRVRDIRLIVSKYSVGFHTVSGWLLGTLKPVLKEIVQSAKLSKGNQEEVESLTDVAASILGVIFYICSLDLRVRTSYNLCQILAIAGDLKDVEGTEHYDRLVHVISEEVRILIEGIIARRRKQNDVSESIELYNLLICGAHYLGAEFIGSKICLEALDDVVSRELRYFGYITAKFCWLKNVAAYKERMQGLNELVLARIVVNAPKVKDDSELFLLLCDFVGAPDVSLRDKRSALEAVFGGRISNATIEKLSAYLGFADWTGMRIEHTLRRKELRPVYAWA